MAIVKINTASFDPADEPEMLERYARRAEQVAEMPGFLGFELLRPLTPGGRYLACTWWRSEADFVAWSQTPQFVSGRVAPGAELTEFEIALRLDPPMD